MKSAPNFVGKEFKAFWNDPAVWGDSEWYIEDTIFNVNGTETYDIECSYVMDTDQVMILDGYMHYQGLGDSKESQDLVKVAHAWLKAQTTKIVTIEVNKKQEAWLLSLVAQVDSAKVIS